MDDGESNIRRIGTLASGNHYKLTDSEITVTDPDGHVLYQAAYADLRSVRDSIDRVTLVHDEHGRTDLRATSRDDARLIASTILANRAGKRPTSLRALMVWIGVAGLLIAGIVVVGLIGTPQESDEPSRRDRAPLVDDSSRRVRYRVTTSGRQHPISLTYENKSGNTEQLETTSRSGSWTHSLTKEVGDFVYISVQNGADSGTVACEILVEGRVVEEATSSGAYVIATCSGSVKE